jgi:hypothetical protein
MPLNSTGYTENRGKTAKESGRKYHLKERDVCGDAEQNARVGQKSESKDCEKKDEKGYLLFIDPYKTETTLQEEDYISTIASGAVSTAESNLSAQFDTTITKV